MPEAFDPYYKWLAIAPEDQPPDCYRLLGVRTFEDDPDVIENASDQRMAHLRTFQSGKHSEESQNLLNEVAAAKILLLNPEKKAKYDETLREQMRIRAEGGDDEEISSQLTGFLRAVELDDQFAAKPAGRTLPKATPLDFEENRQGRQGCWPIEEADLHRRWSGHRDSVARDPRGLGDSIWRRRQANGCIRGTRRQGPTTSATSVCSK